MLVYYCFNTIHLLSLIHHISFSSLAPAACSLSLLFQAVKDFVDEEVAAVEHRLDQHVRTRDSKVSQRGTGTISCF